MNKVRQHPRRSVLVMAGLALAAGLALVFALRQEPEANGAKTATTKRKTAQAIPEAPATDATPAPKGSVAPDADANESAPVLTAAEKAEAEAEARVEAFDALTDKWMEPVSDGISMADVDAFGAAFRRLPKDRQDECIHRALNLIPDDNALLLVGVLMDKSIDKEIVETVFNDILNRDEDVKKPILKQVFADKTHPCWADTAWILDVTGETP